MKTFFSKHSATLQTTALLLMLVIPFLLYAAARYGTLFQVKAILSLMMGNMLFVMIKG